MTTMTQPTTKERIAEKAGWGLTDRLDKEARLAERERCRMMLSEYARNGHSATEVATYAMRLLESDY